MTKDEGIRIPTPILLIGGPFLGLVYIMSLPVVLTAAIAGGIGRMIAPLWKSAAGHFADKNTAPHSVIP
jgi:hypothetical protein